MIIPHLKNDALLDDIKIASLNHSSFHLWWLGQSGFLLQWQNQHLLIDPYLSDSLTKKYAHTEIPHLRMTELVVDPARLNFIDVVTSSHNHTDHLDAETLIPLLKANPNLKLIIPEANRNFVAERLNIAATIPLGLNDGESLAVNGFTFNGVAAAHENIERDELGRCKFMGYVIQFGGWSIYHSGDTVWHDEIVAQLQRFSIDLAILPINGRAAARKVAGNLGAKEAVTLAKRINARLVIPCHYDMFTFNTADPAEFVKEAEAQNQAYRVLQCGERWSGAA
ncbi:MAG: MBL fold metallo-hydrolase [candidate division KSB1 bacterium]|nr:MBL fold metallo-hydrolase [candidate division KSB1 bacterium]MDZ7364836.1 MBL fold metallo-hydrolase [candidate division KSB1 bacterium]MDZ7402939.1 MBL fold metallo-hydrolase [candidate division KSB1 bacterium]